MKHNNLDFIEECLAIAATHFVLVGVFLTVMGCFGQKETNMVLWLGMIALPYFFYFLRSKIKNFPLFFILHVIWPFAVFLLVRYDYTLSIMAFVLAWVYVILSIKNKVKDKDKKQEAPTASLAVIVFSVGMVMQMIWGVKEWANYYMILVFAYFACYYIYLFLHQYLQFIRFNRNSTGNIPEKEIFTSGLTQAIAYTIGGLAIVFVSANLGWFTFLTDKIGSALLAGLRFLISILPKRVIDNGEFVEDDIEHWDSGHFENEVVHNETFESALLLVVKVFIVCFIALIIFAAIKAFRNMWKDYAAKKIAEDMMEVQNEVRENLDVVEDRKRERGKGLFGFMDNKEKIRKFYKKRVTKDKKAIIGNLDTESLQYYTAKECCDKISADNLQSVYDKVRYSADEITADDVKFAKSDEK